MLIAAGCGPARVPTCEQVLWYGRSKFYHLIAVGNERWLVVLKKMRQESDSQVGGRACDGVPILCSSFFTPLTLINAS
jgi:hypothetical protein